MFERLALKHLVHTDVTLFNSYFKKHTQSRQKGITLNADVFVDVFYPALRSSTQIEFRVDLQVFGPGLAGEYPLVQKIRKEQKNWRLNGVVIHNPPEEPNRFDMVSPGDLALMNFSGDLFPESVKLYVISASSSDDRTLHSLLSQHVSSGRNSMALIEISMLQEIILNSGLPTIHPVYDFLLEDVLQDAAQNGIEGIRRLQVRASTKRVSPETLQQARANASRVGRVGEEFINSYLSKLVHAGEIQAFEWVSEINAVSPYDFHVDTSGGRILIDVKSTGGDFDNPFHISYNELLKMREGPERFDLYRVYSIVANVAQVRVAEDLKHLAVEILNILEQLPQAVRPDSISIIMLDILSFQPPFTVYLDSDEDVV